MRVTQEAAFNTVGEVPSHVKKPWLKEKAEELHKLNLACNLSQTRLGQLNAIPRPWTADQTEQHARAKDQHKRAKKLKRSTTRRWEDEYWTSIADQAEAARDRGDIRAMHVCLRSIEQQAFKNSSTQWKASSKNIQSELKSWQNHFSKVHKTRGKVHPRVWKNIPQRRPINHSMGDAPDDFEILECVKAIPLGKAPGKDGVLVELLKYAGEDLLKWICDVVREMWTETGGAEAGLEADHWPEEWKIGIMIPL